MVTFFERKDLRRISVERFGSPNFPVTFGALAAGGGEEPVDMAEDFPASQKYLPLQSLVVTNRSGAFVDLEVNGIFYATLPAGVIETVTQYISTFRLTNNDAVNAVAAGEITANLKTPPLGADEAARKALIGR